MEQLSIKKNFAYKSVLTVSSYLMAFVTFPYVSRVLGVETLGLVNFVDNTVNYFLLFATMGISLLGVREIAAIKDNQLELERVFSSILGLNLLFTLGALIVYFSAISLVPQLYQYSELFYIGGAKILCTVFLVEWFFTGIENFQYITIRSIIIKILYVLAVFCLVRTSDDYKLYFVLTIGVVVLNALVNIAYVRKFIHIRFEHMMSKKYAKQNLSLGIYSIMTSMYLTFNVMFLGLVSNNTEVGYYTTAFKLYSVVLSLFTAFTNVMLPRMSSLLARGEQEQFYYLGQKSISLIYTFGIPMMLFGVILAPQIIYVLSGIGYEGAILPMRIIMPAILFVGIAQVLAVQILMPMRKDKMLLKASILGALISIVINVLIASTFHSIGASITLLCAEFVVTITYLLYAMKRKLIMFPAKKLLWSLLYNIPVALLFWCITIIFTNSFFALFFATLILVVVVLLAKKKHFFIR